MKHRIFIAFALPNELYEPVSGLQKQLTSLSPLIKPVEQEKLHMTLNFLGNVEEQRMSGIIKALRDSVAGSGSFSLVPHFLGTFYNRHEESVIFLEPTGEVDRLKEIQNQFNQIFEKMQLPQQWKFTPHITIAKIDRSDPTSVKQALDQVHNLDTLPLPAVNIDRLTVFESFSTRNGTHYRRLSEISLV